MIATIAILEFLALVAVTAAYEVNRRVAKTEYARLSHSLDDAMRTERESAEILKSVLCDMDYIKSKAIVVPEGTPVDLAERIVDRLDEDSQNGEWKYHQAYSALLKTPEGEALSKADEKWKIGLAIHVAIARRRMS